MTCGICLSTLGDGKSLAVTDCGHLFHETCLRECLRHRPKWPSCTKLGKAVIKVFTTIDLAAESGNPAEDVESSQAYLEVKNENVGLKRQLGTAEATIQKQQEQADIRELAHEHYQIELLDRACQWQENFLHRQAKLTRLRNVEEELKQERREKEEITKRHLKRKTDHTTGQDPENHTSSCRAVKPSLLERKQGQHPEL